jgi:diadenosine tetraphosphate (Ap4A) HIT family hydrolase
MTESCLFCEPSDDEVILCNHHCYVRYDRFPVNPGHFLIIPFRHVADFFDLSQLETTATLELLSQAKVLLDAEYKADGYNIGVNVGPIAGQTVSHVHIHLIPRYAGDVDDPRGGVRGVIPEKRIYPNP